MSPACLASPSRRPVCPAPTWFHQFQSQKWCTSLSSSEAAYIGRHCEDKGLVCIQTRAAPHQPPRGTLTHLVSPGSRNSSDHVEQQQQQQQPRPDRAVPPIHARAPQPTRAPLPRSLCRPHSRCRGPSSVIVSLSVPLFGAHRACDGTGPDSARDAELWCDERSASRRRDAETRSGRFQD